MLYDASRAGNLTPAWFDPAHWRERGELEGEARGRGAALFINASGRALVLRHYRRGGLVSGLSKDRYWWRNEQATRPFAEWQLTYHLHRAGLPVPAPVAARYRRRGLTYTGDIITERLLGVETLAARLRKGAVPILHWIEIGRCIRAFHDLGVCHADLNAHNVMLGAGTTVYLIDFDRGRLRKPGLWCDGNLVRLRRSLEKITYGLPPDRISEADWHGLLDGYREPRVLAAPLAPASSNTIPNAISAAASGSYVVTASTGSHLAAAASTGSHVAATGSQPAPSGSSTRGWSVTPTATPAPSAPGSVPAQTPAAAQRAAVEASGGTRQPTAGDAESSRSSQSSSGATGTQATSAVTSAWTGAPVAAPPAASASGVQSSNTPAAPSAGDAQPESFAARGATGTTGSRPAGGVTSAWSAPPAEPAPAAPGGDESDASSGKAATK